MRIPGRKVHSMPGGRVGLRMFCCPTLYDTNALPPGMIRVFCSCARSNRVIQHVLAIGQAGDDRIGDGLEKSSIAARRARSSRFCPLLCCARLQPLRLQVCGRFCCAFSASADRTLKLWNLATGARWWQGIGRGWSISCGWRGWSESGQHPPIITQPPPPSYPRQTRAAMPRQSPPRPFLKTCIAGEIS